MFKKARLIYNKREYFAVRTRTQKALLYFKNVTENHNHSI